MRTAAPLLTAILLSTANLFSQNTATVSETAAISMESRQQSTEMGQAARDEFEYKQFAGQARKLRDGLTKNDFNKVAAQQSSILNAMRREIGQARASISEEKNTLPKSDGELKPDPKTSEKKRVELLAKQEALDEKEESLARMQVILAEIQSFVFKNDDVKTTESKLKMIDEFGQILQKNMVDEYQKMGPQKNRGRN